MKPWACPAYFGVAIADLNNARRSRDPRRIAKQERRLARMLRKYGTHPDVIEYAASFLKPPDRRALGLEP